MFPVIQPDRVPPQLKIRNLRILPGEKVEGWTFGKLVIAVVHFNGEVSKPCAFAMSGGGLTCGCQSQPMRTRKIGYLPLLTKDNARICIIVSNGVALEMEGLLHASPLVIGRTKVPKSPVWWNKWDIPSPTQIEYGKRVQRSTPVDISEWLLNLWGNEPLKRFYNKDPDPLDRAAPIPPSGSQQPPPSKSNKKGK